MSIVRCQPCALLPPPPLPPLGRPSSQSHVLKLSPEQHQLVMLIHTSSVASIGHFHPCNFHPCSSRDHHAFDNSARSEDRDWESDHPSIQQHGHHQHGGEQQEEEECMHKAGSGDCASLPGWNTARDLLLQHQKTSKEEAIPPQGKAGNPFARSKPKVSMLV